VKYDRNKHHRRSLRLKGYDYSQAGAYFVTICTEDRQCLFGDVADGHMELNEAGQAVQETWKDLTVRFPSVVLDTFVAMPNHIHGIITMVQGAATSAPPLGDIMRAFKSVSAIQVNRLLLRSGQPLWQRNYYERILRTEEDLNCTRQYILDNPAKWSEDADNPQNL
jgi:REP element-mobilizing transposase RayT